MSVVVRDVEQSFGLKGAILFHEGLRCGREIDEKVAAEVARAAVRGATPTEKNSYKVPILETVIKRTLLAAMA